jgi:hypothetical protein
MGRVGLKRAIYGHKVAAQNTKIGAELEVALGHEARISPTPSRASIILHQMAVEIGIRGRNTWGRLETAARGSLRGGNLYDRIVNLLTVAHRRRIVFAKSSYLSQVPGLRF